MEYVNLYSRFLLQKSHEKRILSEQILKPNKNLRYTSAKLYYYFDTNPNETPFDQLKHTLYANMNLYKQDLLEDLSKTENLYEISADGSIKINDEKEIFSLPLDRLRHIYKEKYQEFEKDSIDKPFIENLFSHFETSFRENLENQNKEIVKMYNESNKTEEKLDNLSYNEYSRSGVDYFDATKKYYNTLMEHLNSKVELEVNLKKYNDQVALDNIVLSTVKNLHDVYELRSRQVYAKLYTILKKNKSVISNEEKYLKLADNYLAYLNFAYFSKDFSDSNVNILQRILRDQYRGNVGLIINLLNKYGYVNKERALELCEDIGDVNSTVYSSFQNRHQKGSFQNLLTSFITDIFVNIKYKNIFKSDIEKGDFDKLVNHLKEYDSYAIANFKYDSVAMLNMYAITHSLNEKIYEDYLNNLGRLKH